MDISLFWEFLVLTEVRNYSAAAYQLSTSESSLSRHIKALEQELGVTLFERNPRSVKTTPYGDALITYAKQIMEIRQRYIAEFRQITRKLGSAVTVCSSYNIEQMLAAFHVEYPDSNVVMVSNSGNPLDIVTMLRSGECEVGFLVYLPDNCDGLTVHDYDTDCFAAVLPVNHPLAERKTVALSDLAYEEFISFSNNFITAKLIEHCREAGFTPHILSYADGAASISSLIKYNGVSLLLKKIAQTDNFPGVRLVDIEPPIPVNIHLCYLTGAKLSAGALQLIDFALHFQSGK